MAEDLYWDHSAEDFENQLSLQSRQSNFNVETDETIILPRKKLYALMLDLQRLQDALLPYLRNNVESTGTSNFYQYPPTKFQRLKWWAIRVTNYVLLITTLLQIFIVAFLSIIDVVPKGQKHAVEIVGHVIMFSFQICNLVLIIIAAAQILKNMYEDKSPAFLYLTQTYISSILFFAGIYLTIFLYQKNKAWHHMNIRVSDFLKIELFCRFIFFSVSCGTLSGDSETVPNVWYTWLLVSFQVLLSYVFFGAVISQAVFSRVENRHLSTMRKKKSYAYVAAQIEALRPVNDFQAALDNDAT